MYTSKDSFIQEYEREGQLTLNCLKELTDESLQQAVTENDRTLGEIAWHITQSAGGFASLTGETFEGARFTPDSAPDSAEEIADIYEKTYKSVLDSYQQTLTDANLLDEADMFGTKMPKGALLQAANLHQVHHRGQMTVLMRQADLHVPSIYGPSRDDK
ncbi:hypothetical protein ERX27_00750 [Macrococcus brunensis]|uniref:Damage-inducible protein DinB n=1 Tax=Macrococcus brunensis TaxID=198483 RepID=A0A4R6BGH4_9STAP|nr:DinB family protein [Macrococcus brunensis]TDL99004.1 hypothetical protein ERX27_00750 [Macrococcus brunensis]ULG72464.1 DinB family protein [Macrococcus brunensis]ULG74719.1 DinB family protein [Macrococcus brunensis]